MQLQSAIRTLFKDTFDGFPSIRFASASETVAFEAQLRQEKLSYQTKITKNRKRGVSFVVMLVEKAA